MNEDKPSVMPPVPPFVRFVASAVPMVFDDSLSYYEALCALWKYVSDMTDVINNNATLEEEYILKFNELKSFVDNYFDNLDVQDEINNKLDAMAEDGSLEELINNVLQPNVTWTFDTVADMKASTNLVSGCFAKTLGFYSVNDGGGAVYKIANSGTANEMDIIACGSLYAVLNHHGSINVKQFGAKGDGTTDDTSAIQRAVDYGFQNNLNVTVLGSANYYKVTLPIILRSTRANTPIGEYWSGKSSKLVGEYNGSCRIVKVGTDVYSDTSDAFINNVNATIICSKGSGSDLGTGIYIENLTIENYATYDGENYTRTSSSYALYTNIARSIYKNLTVIGYYGIKAESVFSSYFENIDMFSVEEGIDLNNGTSNTFRYLYASGVHNPYKLSTYYSTLMNCCADDCTGSLFTLGGTGLSLISCGSESRKAQYIFNFPVANSNITISDYRMDRFVGDTGLSIADCAVCMFATNGVNVNINDLTIVESQQLDTTGGNSAIFTTNASNRVITTNLNNLRYDKAYSGTDNDPCVLWGANPTRACVQSLTTPTQSFKYFVGSDKSAIPFIGSINDSSLGRNEGGKTLGTGSVSYNKTIWLDTKDQYHAENGTDMRYTGRHQVGDIQLFNDPLTRNALGLSIVGLGTESWTIKQIPLVLAGASSSKPTSNLYDGLMYFDTTLHKPVWYNSYNNTWYDASGTNAYA